MAVHPIALSVVFALVPHKVNPVALSLVIPTPNTVVPGTADLIVSMTEGVSGNGVGKVTYLLVGTLSIVGSFDRLLVKLLFISIK